MSTYLIYNEYDELEDVVNLSDREFNSFKLKNPDVNIVAMEEDDPFIDSNDEDDEDYITEQIDEWGL